MNSTCTRGSQPLQSDIDSHRKTALLLQRTSRNLENQLRDSNRHPDPMGQYLGRRTRHTSEGYDTTRYDTVDLRALKSWRDG